MQAGKRRLHEIAERMKAELNSGATPTGEHTTVRKLLRWFGYERRGSWIVARIRAILAKLDLRIVPDFEYEYIDGEILIELDKDATGVQREPVDPTVRIGMLPTSHRRPTRVRPNDPLDKATTIMLVRDFSQLPVMVNERDVKGVISWRSIGSALTFGHEISEVRECMEPHRETTVEAPFFNVIKDIQEHGYVLVRDRDKTISGIVTASDFSVQFAQLAQPFLVIGEIELHLRNLVSRFTFEEMADASDDSKRPIESSSDLNFGAYIQLLENPDRWEKLGVRVDRSTFIRELEGVRETRNEVMHFAPDGPDPERVPKLERVAIFLRKLTQDQRR